MPAFSRLGRSLGILILAAGGVTVPPGIAADLERGSLWQSGISAAGPAAPQPASGIHQYLMLDTGGSGGMFGQGDVRSNLLSVDFWNDKLGWSAGDGGVFRSEDGGVSWKRVRVPADVKGGRWVRVAMRGEREIWLLRAYHGKPRAELFLSRDGGSDWRQQLAGKLQGAKDLHVRGRDIWVLCGDYPGYHSGNGGETWNVESFGGLLHGAVAISLPGDIRWKRGYSVYVLGHYQRQMRLVKSQDSGRSWAVVPLPGPLPPRPWLGRLHFATSHAGAIGLDDGRVLLTRDGGRTWISTIVSAGRSITALWIDQSGRGFAAVENNNLDNPGTALFSKESFESEWQVAYGGRVQLNDIAGYRNDRLWAVGGVVGIIPNDAVLHITGDEAPR